MATVPPRQDRLASLDQFRGYTVAGMFLVNFVGSFAVTPPLLKHHNTFCSYADTIMPQFFFAVGFALRLTYFRRVERDGRVAAYRHYLRRIAALALIAIVVYTPGHAPDSWQELVSHGPAAALKPAIREWFQTLMHIAVTTLWVLPVLGADALTRIAYGIFSAALHLAASQMSYFSWVQTAGIDGGVLGFLAWTIPVIAGTLACDAVSGRQRSPRVGGMFTAAVVLMLVGWLLSCGTTLYDVLPGVGDPLPGQLWAADPVIPSTERWQSHRLTWAEPPFVPPPPAELREENYWMMSQRACTLSYHLFAAGLSLALYALFYVACDRYRLQLGLFRTLGRNALMGYILHGIVGASVGVFMPKDSPGWYVAAGFLVYFGVTYLFLAALERQNIYLRL